MELEPIIKKPVLDSNSPANEDESKAQPFKFPHHETRISCGFILQSPPGEFKEVFSDVRSLVNNDSVLMDESVLYHVLAKYNKDQLTPVKIQGTDHSTLITDFNDLGNDCFYDPKSQQSFKYDHLRKEAFSIGKFEPDQTAEPWRRALEQALTPYVQDHYRHGTCCVFGYTDCNTGMVFLTTCIEDHQFQPVNFWNGSWRSVWNVTLNPNSMTSVELYGTLKIQVHYYEDGNVQLLSSKEIRESLMLSSRKQFEIDFVKVVGDAEVEYQTALAENYQTMSDTTFKALRRLLPVTRTKIDWTKILTYRVGSDLKHC